MGKHAGFDAELWVGTQQTFFATVVCDGAGTAIDGDGDGDFTVRATGIAGGAVTVDVGLLIGDTAVDVVRKAVVAMNDDTDIADYIVMYAVGHLLYGRVIAADGNDAGLDIEYLDDSCSGLAADDAGTAGVTGVAELEIAYVTNISGPGLGVDTEDVTTHDQATAWEETIATIIRSGEVTVDIVYDPVNTTHNAALGLLSRLETKLYSFFKLIFSNDTEWEFSGYVIGFEPSEPVGGALTASVKAKITSLPLLV